MTDAMAILLTGVAVDLIGVGFAAATGRIVTIRGAGAGDDAAFDGVDGVGVDAAEFVDEVVEVVEVEVEVNNDRVGRPGGVSLEPPVCAAIFRGWCGDPRFS